MIKIKKSKSFLLLFGLSLATATIIGSCAFAFSTVSTIASGYVLEGDSYKYVKAGQTTSSFFTLKNSTNNEPVSDVSSITVSLLGQDALDSNITYTHENNSTSISVSISSSANIGVHKATIYATITRTNNTKYIIEKQVLFNVYNKILPLISLNGKTQTRGIIATVTNAGSGYSTGTNIPFTAKNADDVIVQGTMTVEYIESSNVVTSVNVNNIESQHVYTDTSKNTYTISTPTATTSATFTLSVSSDIGEGQTTQPDQTVIINGSYGYASSAQFALFGSETIPEDLKWSVSQTNGHRMENDYLSKLNIKINEKTGFLSYGPGKTEFAKGLKYISNDLSDGQTQVYFEANKADNESAVLKGYLTLGEKENDDKYPITGITIKEYNFNDLQGNYCFTSSYNNKFEIETTAEPSILSLKNQRNVAAGTTTTTTTTVFTITNGTWDNSMVGEFPITITASAKNCYPSQYHTKIVIKPNPYNPIIYNTASFEYDYGSLEAVDKQLKTPDQERQRSFVRNNQANTDSSVEQSQNHSMHVFQALVPGGTWGLENSPNLVTLTPNSLEDAPTNSVILKWAIDIDATSSGDYGYIVDTEQAEEKNKVKWKPNSYLASGVYNFNITYKVPGYVDAKLPITLTVKGLQLGNISSSSSIVVNYANLDTFKIDLSVSHFQDYFNHFGFEFVNVPEQASNVNPSFLKIVTTPSYSISNWDSEITSPSFKDLEYNETTNSSGIYEFNEANNFTIPATFVAKNGEKTMNGICYIKKVTTTTPTEHSLLFLNDLNKKPAYKDVGGETVVSFNLEFGSITSGDYTNGDYAIESITVPHNKNAEAGSTSTTYTIEPVQNAIQIVGEEGGTENTTLSFKDSSNPKVTINTDSNKSITGSIIVDPSKFNSVKTGHYVLNVTCKALSDNPDHESYIQSPTCTINLEIQGIATNAITGSSSIDAIVGARYYFNPSNTTDTTHILSTFSGGDWKNEGNTINVPLNFTLLNGYYSTEDTTHSNLITDSKIPDASFAKLEIKNDGAIRGQLASNDSSSALFLAEGDYKITIKAAKENYQTQYFTLEIKVKNVAKDSLSITGVSSLNLKMGSFLKQQINILSGESQIPFTDNMRIVIASSSSSTYGDSSWWEQNFATQNNITSLENTPFTIQINGQLIYLLINDTVTNNIQGCFSTNYSNPTIYLCIKTEQTNTITYTVTSTEITGQFEEGEITNGTWTDSINTNYNSATSTAFNISSSLQTDKQFIWKLRLIKVNSNDVSNTQDGLITGESGNYQLVGVTLDGSSYSTTAWTNLKKDATVPVGTYVFEIEVSLEGYTTLKKEVTLTVNAILDEYTTINLPSNVSAEYQIKFATSTPQNTESTYTVGSNLDCYKQGTFSLDENSITITNVSENLKTYLEKFVTFTPSNYTTLQSQTLKNSLNSKTKKVPYIKDASGNINILSEYTASTFNLTFVSAKDSDYLPVNTEIKFNIVLTPNSPNYLPLFKEFKLKCTKTHMYDSTNTTLSYFSMPSHGFISKFYNDSSVCTNNAKIVLHNVPSSFIHEGDLTTSEWKMHDSSNTSNNSFASWKIYKVSNGVVSSEESQVIKIKSITTANVSEEKTNDKNLTFEFEWEKTLPIDSYPCALVWAGTDSTEMLQQQFTVVVTARTDIIQSISQQIQTTELSVGELSWIPSSSPTIFQYNTENTTANLTAKQVSQCIEDIISALNTSIFTQPKYFLYSANLIAELRDPLTKYVVGITNDDAKKGKIKIIPNPLSDNFYTQDASEDLTTNITQCAVLNWDSTQYISHSTSSETGMNKWKGLSEDSSKAILTNVDSIDSDENKKQLLNVQPWLASDSYNDTLIHLGDAELDENSTLVEIPKFVTIKTSDKLYKKRIRGIYGSSTSFNTFVTKGTKTRPTNLELSLSPFCIDLRNANFFSQSTPTTTTDVVESKLKLRNIVTDASEDSIFYNNFSLKNFNAKELLVVFNKGRTIAPNTKLTVDDTTKTENICDLGTTTTTTTGDVRMYYLKNTENDVVIVNYGVTNTSVNNATLDSFSNYNVNGNVVNIAQDAFNANGSKVSDTEGTIVIKSPCFSSVTLPATLTQIQTSSFANQTNLTNLTFTAPNSSFSLINSGSGLVIGAAENNYEYSKSSDIYACFANDNSLQNISLYGALTTNYKFIIPDYEASEAAKTTGIFPTLSHRAANKCAVHVPSAFFNYYSTNNIVGIRVNDADNFSVPDWRYCYKFNPNYYTISAITTN